MYFSKRMSEHYGVEHDPQWFQKIEKSLDADRFKLIEAQSYVSAIAEFNKTFGLIIIDGINRQECLLYSPAYLSEDGIIVLDAAARDEYQESIDKLLNKGFKKIDFVGMKAFGRHASSTAIFYKEGNWLNI